MLNSTDTIKLNDNNKESNSKHLKTNISKKLVKNKKKISKNNRKNQNKILDYIFLEKFIASFSVVILHTNNKFWAFDYKIYKQYWISANIIESIFHFAVPFFILCIGATLLDFNEKYGLIIYFKRRIKKVVIPLICWNIILYYYYIYAIKYKKKEKITFVYLWNLFFDSKLNYLFKSIHSFLIMYMINPLLAYV